MTVINFVARGNERNPWALVLVEEGPWPLASIDERLREIQSRIYDVLDFLLAGKVDEMYEDARGKKILIQLEAIDPPPEVHDFFVRFTGGIRSLPGYEKEIAEHGREIGFKLCVSATIGGEIRSQYELAC